MSSNTYTTVHGYGLRDNTVQCDWLFTNTCFTRNK